VEPFDALQTLWNRQRAADASGATAGALAAGEVVQVRACEKESQL